MSQTANVLSPEYDRAVKVAMALQLPTAAVAMMLLDGGQLARLYGCLLAGFWIGVATIASRRPFSPRGTELAVIRWGTVPVFAAAVVLRMMVG